MNWLYQPRRPLTEAEISAITAFPGVYWRTKGPTRGHIEAPVNAAWLVERQLSGFGIPVIVKPPLDGAQGPSPWAQIRAQLLAAGEVRASIPNGTATVELDAFALAHQKEALAFAACQEGSHLWHVPGSGKTFTLTLWLLCNPGAALVVTRASAKRQWAGEVARFTHLKPFVLKGKAEYRKKDPWHSLEEYLDWCATQGQRPFVIIGWEALPSHLDILLAKMGSLPGGFNAGFDESQKGKSNKRVECIIKEDGKKKFKGLGNVVDCASQLAKVARRRCLTTGTPIKNRLPDLWGQLDIAHPWAWGSFRQWTGRYAEGHVGPYQGWVALGMSHTEELLARLSFHVHRVSAEQLAEHLPPMRRTSRYLSADEQDHPRSFAAELKSAMKRGPTAILETRLAESASMKRTAVVEMVAERLEAGQKIVIFTGRNRDVADLDKAIRARCGKICPDVWAASGSGETATDLDEREEIRLAYMASPGPACLIATGDSFGTAFNLQDTDAAYLVMLPWAPGDLDQWERRFVRLSGGKSVEIIYVICEGTVDEIVVSKLISKLPAVEKISGDRGLAAAYVPLTGTDNREKLAADMMAMLMHAAEFAVLEDDIGDEED